MLCNKLARNSLLNTTKKLNIYKNARFVPLFKKHCRTFTKNNFIRNEKSSLRFVADELLEQPKYAFPDFLRKAAPTKVTTLENGFRVVSEPRIGSTAAVGVFIKAGSRQENKYNNGVAHFLEHMYFKGTKNRTAQSLEIEYENAGAQLNAHTAREYTCFTSHCLANDIERSVDSLSDILLNSNISRKDIESERSTILREQQEVATNVDEVLFDELHQAAFPDSSLGFTILGPKENIQTLTQEQMIEYRDTFYTAPNMILVGVGNVDHNELVRLGQKYFGKLPSEPKHGLSNTVSPANYVGGEIRIHDTDIKQLYSCIAFKGPSIDSADILVVNLIQILLGNWDQAMGVGKHIASPFCASIAEMQLARSVSVFNHAYSDTGLFGVQLLSEGEQLQDIDTLHCLTANSMTRLCYKVREDDLERAKNIFKNQILSQYEGRLDSVLEEIGKQMLFYGRRPTAAEMFARIEKVTPDDVMRVANKYIYDKDPVVVNIGDTDNAIDWTWIRMFTYWWR